MKVNESALRAALAPLADRFPKIVREHEILRISANLGGIGRENLTEAARKHILAWVQNRCGGTLPPDAWKGYAFEYFSGGRNSLGIRLTSDEADLWAIRAEDPDKTVPGRVWTTEIVVGELADKDVSFSARLLVSTKEESLNIEPHTPGFVQQLAERCGLSRRGYELSPIPWTIESKEDASTLVEMLLDPQRTLPYYVLTTPTNGSERAGPLLNAGELGRALVGMGLVAIVPSEFTWTLSESLGKQLSVFGGAVSSYLPGFKKGSSPWDHRLVVADRLSTSDDIAQCVRWIRNQAAAESIRSTRIDVDVLSFGTIKNASIQADRIRLIDEGASDTDKLANAQKIIESQKKKIEEDQGIISYFEEEFHSAVERAKAAEDDYRRALFRNRHLENLLSGISDNQGETLEIPIDWDQFVDWCQQALADRVVLTPSARSSVRAPVFNDPQLAARCLNWLATICRDQRIGNLGGSLREAAIEDGIRNSHCGNDAFDFDWQGRRLTADWHVKNGGNTRDPSRCLRIYYGWDDYTQQIIIAAMPAHRRTGAT